MPQTWTVQVFGHDGSQIPIKVFKNVTNFSNTDNYTSFMDGKKEIKIRNMGIIAIED